MSGLLDSQTFNSSTTYTVPTGAKFIVCEIVGAGGGGGGGARNTGTGTAGGGGGAGGGAYLRTTLIAGVDFTAGGSVTVTVGTGGTGGAGRTASAGSGTSGNAGGNTLFATAQVIGATAGNPGTNAQGGVGGQGYWLWWCGGAPANSAYFGTGATGGITNSGTAVSYVGYFGGGGGGAGAGCSTAAFFGRAGSLSQSNVSNAMSAADYRYIVASTNGQGNGGNPSVSGGNATTAGGGGGGGGSSITAATPGGNGGNGLAPGGAGGGGGGGSNDQNGGNGGNGAAGQIKVWVYG
jgi:hypothetical protein